MPTFPVDQPVRLTFPTFSDAAETTPADPTTVSLDLLAPGATTPVTYTLAGGQVVRDSLGVFHYDVLATVAGHYTGHWKATGTVATSQDVEFDVAAEFQYGYVSVDDLALELNDPDLNRVRARRVLDNAQRYCETVVKPLPPGADLVVLDVAIRAFANPTNSGSSSPAYYAEGEGPFSDTTPGFTGGGYFLTRANKATLRRLNGTGAAFSIPMLPSSDDLSTLPWWDTSSAGW